MLFEQALYMQAGVPTRQISAENPTGEKGGGCAWDPDPSNPFLSHSGAATELGRGWKVRPFISVKSGETAVLADINGPSVINQIFLTSDAKYYSDLVLRIYWDNEESPSVECPMGAFYAMGFDKHPHHVTSLPVTVAPARGMNCYWQMPFRKKAAITITNDGDKDAGILAYRVLYKLLPVDEGAAYFHAQYRRAMTTPEYPVHVILDEVKGKGLYVGTYLAWYALSPGWWGEGEVKFYLDGDTSQPTLCDNGTEDYFGGAWGFCGPDKEEEAFSSPFLGMPLAVCENNSGPRKFGMYRWHILDSIGFSYDIRVTVQALGYGCHPDWKYRPLSDDIASVAYWYQTEPHGKFPELPDYKARRDR